MGQARQRRAEIDQLKAQGPRRPMARFMVRGRFNPDGTVAFPRTDLDTQQQAFVAGCETSLNSHGIPQLQQRVSHPTDHSALAYVMYNGPKDFASAVLPDLKVTPDEAWNQLYGEFVGGLALGRSLTREELVDMGTEQAGWMFDLLKEGGRWPWPNAHAVLEKRGDRMVVIDKF